MNIVTCVNIITLIVHIYVFTQQLDNNQNINKKLSDLADNEETVDRYIHVFCDLSDNVDQ